MPRITHVSIHTYNAFIHALCYITYVRTSQYVYNEGRMKGFGFGSIRPRVRDLEFRV